MKELKVKIAIADRTYGLTVAPSQEEGVRLAASKINKMILEYESQYEVRDKQDVLAMCALQFASKTEQSSINISEQDALAAEKLGNLNLKIEHFLNKKKRS